MIRPANSGDLGAIARIQAASPGAATWNPADYLAHDCRVAVQDSEVVGFLVARETAAGEQEILNLAVDPGWRRRGIGSALVQELFGVDPVAVFLEVRESNQAARAFYEGIGFRPVGLRRNYYSDPTETAIVMRLQSC